jgi:hypothetical protein
MPERRKRMLDPEETQVVSTPLDSASVLSVPLVSPNFWIGESFPESTPAPPRFLSQAEEAQREEKDAFERFEPAPLPTPEPMAEPVAFAAPPVEVVAAPEPEHLEPLPEPARPRFAELLEEPAYTQLSCEYLADYAGPEATEPNHPQPAQPQSSEPVEEAQPDLDKPTFLRRLGF